MKAVVINLKERKEKREYIQEHLISQGMKFDFMTVSKHKNPKRGCLESHLAVIEKSVKSGVKKVLIMEDDAKFIASMKGLADPPSDWDMIYLGGTVHRVMDRKHPGYARVQTWTTHAYMINLEKKELVAEIMKATNYDGEIDRYYLEKIHPKFKCYMCDPMICLQREGFSDIEDKMVNYDFMQQTLMGLRVPESSVDGDGNYVLKLPAIDNDKLPAVSIITPTYKRRKLFDMALRNFANFIYPRNKLEWIIVDDSPEDECVRDMLPRGDKRIKYIHMDNGDEPFTIAMKRNMAVSNSSHKYIIHMDDDDYYPPESILARIKILLKYQDEGIECVGSTLIGTYNIMTNISSMSSDGPISLSEASMAYTRKFWEERPFDEKCLRGEHKFFTEKRLNKIIDLPYSFIIIAMNHRSNFTNELRAGNDSVLKFTDSGEVANFFDTWDEEHQLFIMDLRRYLER
jgi:GR25 family glycosyltransferase involved in LPS biosynthesis